MLLIVSNILHINMRYANYSFLFDLPRWNCSLHVVGETFSMVNCGIFRSVAMDTGSWEALQNSCNSRVVLETENERRKYFWITPSIFRALCNGQDMYPRDQGMPEKSLGGQKEFDSAGQPQVFAYTGLANLMSFVNHLIKCFSNHFKTTLFI